MTARLFLIFLLFTAYHYVKAQHYYTIPDSSIVWTVEWDNWLGGTYHGYYKTSINMDDTIINSKNYEKLYFSYNISQQGSYEGAYRSDTNGLTFFVFKDSINEYLIRDFSKNVGDTVKNIFYRYAVNGKIADFYVEFVDYVNAGPYLLKRMFLRNDSIMPGDMIWIEKIGCTNDFFNISPVDMRWLNCMCYNDTLYYAGDGDAIYQYGKCFGYAGLNEINNNLKISISPNPSTDRLQLNLSQKAEIKILSIQGQELKTFSEMVGETDIDISDFTSGVYIIRAHTDKGIMTKKFIKE
jgi:hypothetical protein